MSIEDLILNGRLAQARLRIAKIKRSDIPSDQYLRLANLARRSGATTVGLKILRPEIFERPRRDERWIKFVAEYAILLVQNGSVREASALVARPDIPLRPEILMARIFCRFEQWQHRDAIADLKEYIRHEKDAYLRLLGEVNLADALIVTHQEAEGLAELEKAFSKLEPQKHERLHAHCLNLRSRAKLQSGNLKGATQDVERAYQMFGGEAAPDSVLIRLQRSLCEAARSGSLRPLNRFRREAVANRSWEAVRRADLSVLVLEPNAKLLRKLYYGTPYPAFRADLVQRYGFQANGDTKLWGNKASKPIALESATKQNKKILEAFLQDDYRPLSVGGIFSLIFPGENYDPAYSPARVHQCLRRFRQWIRQDELPLSLRCRAGEYSIEQTKPVAIEVSMHMESDPIRLIWSRFGARPFKAKEAREHLGMAKATLTRYLARAISNGVLRKDRCLYRFCDLHGP